MSMLQRLDAADALPGAAELRARTYELLRIEPGSAVLDVGCGAGLAVCELSSRGIRAVGVDLSPAMVEEARRRSPETEFLVGDASALPVDGGFAGYRADKVFHELAERHSPWPRRGAFWSRADGSCCPGTIGRRW
ncbi:methyltransferase domain-containing protein [Amycolatopsis sp. cmx-11-32]|uniref:methyltransferase domain-containing protein n=1 Tax=Amycolatopsis sp. cmx-11-32 TaxID=2785796 RepID=UPI0039E2F812